MNILESYYKSKSQDLSILFEELKNKGLYDRCSYPQLMALWDNETTPSLMFIGQEPYGWGGSESIDDLMNEYKKFNLGENYSSPFWSWIWWISEQLGFIGTHPFLYTNLHKFSDVDGGPALEEIINLEDKYFDILNGEIQTLQPSVCVFLSGPNYDRYIKEKFEDVKFQPIEGFSERALVQVQSPQLPEMSFRIYHPKYLNYKQELGIRIVSKIQEIYFASL